MMPHITTTTMAHKAKIIKENGREFVVLTDDDDDDVRVCTDDELCASSEFPNRLFIPSGRVDPSPTFNEVFMRFSPDHRKQLDSFLGTFMQEVFKIELTSCIIIQPYTSCKSQSHHSIRPDPTTYLRCGLASLCQLNHKMVDDVFMTIHNDLKCNSFSLEHCREYLIWLGNKVVLENEETFASAMCTHAQIVVAYTPLIPVIAMTTQDQLMMVAALPMRSAVHMHTQAIRKLVAEGCTVGQLPTFNEKCRKDGVFDKLVYTIERMLETHNTKLYHMGVRYIDRLVSLVSMAYHQRVLPSLINSTPVKTNAKLSRYTPLFVRREHVFTPKPPEPTVFA